MESIQVPFYATQGRYLASENDSLLRMKLRAFCSAQLRRLKMVTSTFTHVFELRGGERDRSRTMSKLSRVLLRSVIKQAPYLVHAMPDGGQPILHNDRDVLALAGTTYDTSSFPALCRYVRMLTYYCRKYRIPLSVDVQTFSSSSPNTFVVRVEQSVHTPRESTLMTMQGYEEWVERLTTEAVAAGRDPDCLYANPNIWDTTESSEWELTAHHMKSRGNVPSYQQACHERIFLYLPQITQVILTLSRNFAYASSAFAIRTPEDAGD